ncbi:MAG: bifunctional (p)ppGpp synthetase/guanosine-3',5'-bis(diphosphate) 3'-pyrophosphohydrolase [Bacteroidota bacterium]|nr:bifunctional (p)ppGpp synthetase/guanosine-3',5'-bis(diphosphate) 3'-pyrophosphohydrolase [Bacteroidota bacterium]
MLIQDPEAEKRRLLKEYRNLLKACRANLERGDKKLIREAFNLALEAHKGMRRKSGELYIFHPLAVATICAKEMGLGKTSIVCALLHDVVEDTDVTLEDIEGKFGPKISAIIDGLTKLAGMVGKTNSIQAENFRKILLTMADDIRVILIKLSDRLHNMRTLEAMARTNQLKIASETLVLFAPLAHRLGLYSIKSELEDLSLKYTEPHIYKEISLKLQQTKTQRNKFIRKFLLPIEESLQENNFSFEIKGRPKSIYSIYNKMRRQGIPFEEVYDLFAIRIILDTPYESEKADCWKAYSIITDYYTPNPERLRDWISVPRGNGYESLHTTVMGPQGKWVEVQIRSLRMDDIAEKGYAAHWKYKDGYHNDTNLEEWLRKIREMLENPDPNAIEFLDDFKLNLFADEVFVFTPKGDLITLPANATALDFAFEIHTQVGVNCLGAKVNHKLVPLSYSLKNGDQVEIITSKKQKPVEDWLHYVVTAKAKSKIKTSLKEDKRRVASEGKEILMRKFKLTHLPWTKENIYRLVLYFKQPSSSDLYYCVGSSIIDKTDLNNALKFYESADKLHERKNGRAVNGQKKKGTEQRRPDLIVIGEDLDLDYSFAKCCNPIPGDDIFGFITIGEGIKIHRTNCSNGIKLMSNYGYRIIRATWGTEQMQDVKTFAVGVKMSGIDSIGIVSKITDIISKELQVNILSITVNAMAGAFEGSMMLSIYHTDHLDRLITKLKSIKGIESVTRFHVEEPVTGTQQSSILK